MVGPRVALSLAFVLLAGLHVVSCGGTTRNPGGGDAGSGASSTGATSSGATGSGATAAQGAAPAQGGSTLLPDPCVPMDAQSNGTECGGIPGYTWLGKLCEPIVCGCEGSECGNLYPTLDACDRARNACYAKAGITVACEKHDDCMLGPRDCCGGCGEVVAEQLLALNIQSKSLYDADLCKNPTLACPDCASFPNPAIYAACIDGQCSVVDVGEQVSCETSDDCKLVNKGCCDCVDDPQVADVMAVARSYVRPARCDGVACDDCEGMDPAGVHAICSENVCTLALEN